MYLTSFRKKANTLVNTRATFAETSMGNPYNSLTKDLPTNFSHKKVLRFARPYYSTFKIESQSRCQYYFAN